MLRSGSKRPFRRGAVPTITPPKESSKAESIALAQPPNPPAPPSPPLSPRHAPRTSTYLDIFARIQTLERLLRVTETDLLSAEEERDLLLTQLAESQAHAAALQRDVLSLQLLRNELVLQRLDARDAADEQALRREVLEEELQRRDRVLRKVREENRILSRENERLRAELGYEGDGRKRKEIKGHLLSTASREALRKVSREALRQFGSVTPATSVTSGTSGTAGRFVEITDDSESTPKDDEGGEGERSKRSSLLVWVEAYGSLTDFPEYRARLELGSDEESKQRETSESRIGPSTAPSSPRDPSLLSPTPTVRMASPRLLTPTPRPARTTFGRAPSSFALRNETPPPVPPIPAQQHLPTGAESAADIASRRRGKRPTSLRTNAITSNGDNSHHLLSPTSVYSGTSSDGEEEVGRPRADRCSLARQLSSDLSTAFASTPSSPSPGDSFDNLHPTIPTSGLVTAGTSFGKRPEDSDERERLDWPAWSATSASNSAVWDSSSSHYADIESAYEHDYDRRDRRRSAGGGETEVDFSLIDPSHIALIEVSTDTGH